MISKRDVQLGKLALRAGMVSKDQINRCLALKKKLFETKGKKVALGALLLKKGYLTEAQLEEIVALHGSENGTSSSADSGRSPRTSKRVKAASGEVETGAAARSRRVKGEDEAGEAPAKPKKAKAAGPEEAEGGEAPAKPKKAKGTVPAKKGRKKDGAEGKGKRQSGQVEASATQSAVDPAVFQSAPEDATDEEDRRIVVCPECGKKYRLRKNQVGKRFPCRRCNHRIKVPADLFQRPLRPSDSGTVEVEEFTLDSSDMEPAESGAGPSGAAKVQAAAATAAATVTKVREAPSLRDLAKAATEAQGRRPKPKTRFGAKEAATMVASLAVLAGLGFGFVQWQAYKARLEQEELQKALDAAFDPWAQEMRQAVAEARSAIEDTQRPPQLLEELGARVARRITEGEGLLEEANRQRAAELIDQELKARDLRRQLLVAKGQRLMAEGGFRVEEALLAYNAAAALAPDDAATQLELGAVLVRARRCGEAVAALGRVKGSSLALALTGLAYERGGAGAKAAEVYGQLQDPLAKVLAARAWLVEGSLDRALETVQSASGLEGQDLAAAKVVEGLIHEAKNDNNKALAAFTDAVKATQDAPWPRIMRAEFLLRHGRGEDAFKDAQNATRIVRTAWGTLVMADAQAMQLDLEGAKRRYEEATGQEATLPEGQRLVEGKIDPFRPAAAGDPRADAWCRLGALALARGDFNAADQAYAQAEQLDPFHPGAQIGFARVLLEQGGDMQQQGTLTENRLVKASALLRKDGGAEADLIKDPASAELELTRARFLLATGHPEDALQPLDRAVGLDPDAEAQVWSIRCQIFERHLTQATKALDASRRALRLEERKDNRAGALFAAAQDAFARGPQDKDALAQAEQGLIAALAVNPFHARAWVLLARVKIASGRADQALADLERAESANGFFRDIFVVRGFLLVRDLPADQLTQQTAQRAGEDFEAALRLEQGAGAQTAESHYGRALVHYRLNDRTAALESLQRCLAADADYAEAYKLRAAIRQSLNDPAAAEDLRRYEQLSRKG